MAGKEKGEAALGESGESLYAEDDVALAKMLAQG
jgi:hypothetical protein